MTTTFARHGTSPCPIQIRRFSRGRSQTARIEKEKYSLGTVLARVFNIDVKICSKCDGKMKIIAVIEDPKVIRKILDYKGLPTKPPSMHPTRGPSKQQNYFEDDFSQHHFDVNFANISNFLD